jgi:hypothetical protein
MKPEKLYKYCHFDAEDRNIQNLKNCDIWMSDPQNFNDPFDSNPELLDYVLSEKDFQKRKKFYHQQPALIEELNSFKDDAELHQFFIDNDKRILISQFKTFGVSCFSANGSNNVMWYYYSDKHEGFTIEMDGQSGFFDKCHLVSYTPIFPKIDLGVVGNSNRTNFMNSVFLTKSPEWTHEEEYRFIHENKKFLYGYIPNDLIAVNLGEFTSHENEERIREVLSDSQFSHVELRRMKRQSNSFKLVPEAI